MEELLEEIELLQKTSNTIGKSIHSNSSDFKNKY